jgi:hypothetical protein
VNTDERRFLALGAARQLAVLESHGFFAGLAFDAQYPEITKSGRQ